MVRVSRVYSGSMACAMFISSVWGLGILGPQGSGFEAEKLETEPLFAGLRGASICFVFGVKPQPTKPNAQIDLKPYVQSAEPPKNTRKTQEAKDSNHGQTLLLPANFSWIWVSLGQNGQVTSRFPRLQVRVMPCIAAGPEGAKSSGGFDNYRRGQCSCRAFRKGCDVDGVQPAAFIVYRLAGLRADLEPLS